MIVAFAVIGLACAILAPSWVSAQPISGAAQDPFAGVEEMIVTGTGAADLLANPNTSAVAFDASELNALKVEDISDLSGYVPNLEIRNPNATNAAFFIRGVGLQDFGANASSSVPIFQDGMPRNASATQLVGLFDISGISVVKGPQGSGLFRNASAGAFVLQTAKPEEGVSGSVRTSVGRITSVDARDANRYGVEAVANAPIYEDIVLARVSTRFSHENPFWENGCANRTPIADRPIQRGGVNAPRVGICSETVTPRERSQVSPFLGRYLGEVDDFGFRGQIRVQPPDVPMDWTFRGELSHLNRDAVTGQAIGTGQGGLGGFDNTGYQEPDSARRTATLKTEIRAANPSLTNAQLDALVSSARAREIYKRPLDRKPYRGDVDTPGRLILETFGGSTTGTIDLESFDIETNIGYLDYKKSQRQDTDITPNRRFPTITDDQGWQSYADIAFTGDAIGTLPLEWKTGLYQLNQKIEANQVQTVAALTRDTEFSEETYSFGVFAEGTYELLEAFTLSGGIRYNWERKDFEIKQVNLSSAVPSSINSQNVVTWDSFTGFGLLRYDFTEEIGTYVKYSRGFKAGQFNPSRPDAANIPGRGYADPEGIDAFEWGLEVSALAGRVSANTTFFFYNYDNYQVFRLTSTPAGVFREVQNANQARNYGAEAELTFLPLDGIAPEEIEGLQVVLRGGWLEATYVEFTNSEERLLETGLVGVSIDYSGRPLINSPNLQASGTITWPLIVQSIGTLTPQYDFTWTDDTPFDPNQGRGEVDFDGSSRFPPYLIGNRAYMLHNVRLSWSPPNETGIQLAGWCRNVTDERYKSFAVDLSTFNSQQLIFVADPRTCGADFSFRW